LASEMFQLLVPFDHPAPSVLIRRRRFLPWT
jgi:hypothetical protein